MVARREQGAVGNVSRGEWGNSKRKSVITNSRIPGKKGKGGENGTRWLHGEHLFHPPRGSQSTVMGVDSTVTHRKGCVDYCQGGRVQGGR